MKKMIAEICKREGKKSVSSKANVSEIMRCLADILSEEALLEGKSAQFSIEFLSYLQKKGQKIAMKNGKTLVDIELNFKVKDLK